MPIFIFHYLQKNENPNWRGGSSERWHYGFKHVSEFNLDDGELEDILDEKIDDGKPNALWKVVTPSESGFVKVAEFDKRGWG